MAMYVGCNDCKYYNRQSCESPCCDCYLCVDIYGGYMSKFERKLNEEENIVGSTGR